MSASLRSTASDSGFNLFIKSFLSALQCEEMIRALATAPNVSAAVYGVSESGIVDDRVRKVRRLTPADEVVSQVNEQLLELRDAVGEHFGIKLTTCEEPEFLRYQPGDFFVAHQDGNTGLLLSEREQRRKISVIVFLNSQSDPCESGTYSGGSLVFSDHHPARQPRQFSLGGEAGILVAFPAETTHEVTPVIAGERYSIVSWYG